MSGPFGPGDTVELMHTAAVRQLAGTGQFDTILAGCVGTVGGSSPGVSSGFVPVLFAGHPVGHKVPAGLLQPVEQSKVGPWSAPVPSDATTLAERSRYGEFKDNAMLAQTLKTDLRAFPGWAKMSPHQRQALDVIMDKVSRIVCGDPNYRDNWHDIQGYAQLVEERLPDTGVPAGAAP